MCLGIPGRVVEMLDGYGDQLALVDVAGENRQVNIGMLRARRPAARRLGDHPHGLRRREDRRAGRGAALAGLSCCGDAVNEP